MSDERRDRATQLVDVKVSVDFIQHTLSAYEHGQRDCANDRIVIVTNKVWSAVNCPIEVGIVPISWLLYRYLLISQAHTAVVSEQRDSANETIVIVTNKI